jgi:hypothetical protein
VCILQTLSPKPSKKGIFYFYIYHGVIVQSPQLFSQKKSLHNFSQEILMEGGDGRHVQPTQPETMGDEGLEPPTKGL